MPATVAWRRVATVSAVRRLGYLAASAALVCTQVAAVAVPMAHHEAWRNDRPGRLLLDVAGNGRFVHDSATPLLDATRLAPGSSASGDVDVENDSASDATLSVRATHVIEDENGCDHAEVWSGDTTCNPLGGELGDWLQVSLSRRQGEHYRPVWSGSFIALERGVTLPGSLGSRSVWPLRMTVTLPYAAGNDTQTDQVHFDLRWTATQGGHGHCFGSTRAA
ncbi:MAG: hypothetical protein ACRDPI_02990 [Nocardioidaceae bacterium]